MQTRKIAPEAAYKQETLSLRSPVMEHAAEDLLKLHPGSDNFVCICTERQDKGKAGKWTEHWTRASCIIEKYEELRQTMPDFEEYNVYVSQLEFKSKKRTARNVAAFNACFVDIDGKLQGIILQLKNVQIRC